MNVRVDLNYPINDGVEVVFRSPVDCSQVTGLKVYYPESGVTTSKEFAFADAHGNNVGNIDHLFAENVVVKVILDVTTSMAFVQNADTNAYLEGRFDGLSDSIVCKSSGDIVAITDSANRPLLGLTVYGKTTQNGTPTPDAPVELESVGNGGSVEVTVCGKNLMQIDTVERIEDWVIDHYGNQETFEGVLKAPFTFSCDLSQADTASGETFDDGAALFRFTIDGTEKPIAGCDFAAPQKYAQGFTVTSGTLTKIEVVNWCGIAGTIKMQLEVGNTATAYEPYKGEIVAIPTPNGLRGIPLVGYDVHLYSGNHTDANGQQWVCDEIDFVRGVHVQRVSDAINPIFGSINRNNPEHDWVSVYTEYSDRMPLSRVISASLQSKSFDDIEPKASLGSDAVLWNANSSWGIGIRRSVLGIDADMGESEIVSLINAWVAEKGITVHYCLTTPVETAQTDHTKIHTYKPHTTITNDGGAEMAVEYVADTKTYIDNKFAELATAIVNNA